MSREKWFLLFVVQCTGIMFISYGCYLVYEPVGYIVPGFYLVSVACVVAYWVTKAVGNGKMK